MLKIIGGAAIVGAFIGAMTVEIVNRYRPYFIKIIEDKDKNTVDIFFNAFREGFRAGSSGENRDI
jgi:hypothetical protein